jgi:DNA-directed RNA polymerase III subunit RPC4
MTQDGDEKPKPDIKPTPAQLRKNKEVLPEGRIGTLVTMKSGKVKMVLGENVVMDVCQSW